MYLNPILSENDMSFFTLKNLNPEFGLLFIGVTKQDYVKEQNKFVGELGKEWGFLFSGYKYNNKKYSRYSWAVLPEEEIRLIVCTKRGTIELDINDQYQGIMFQSEELKKGKL